MRNAIVTGGAGFIGSHVVDRLLADGYEVVVVDDLSTGDARRVPDSADLERVDIVDFEALSRIAAATKPDSIFHLGAQSMVTVSVTDPWRDCDVNVEGDPQRASGCARALGADRVHLDRRRPIRKRGADPNAREPIAGATCSIRGLEMGRRGIPAHVGCR